MTDYFEIVKFLHKKITHINGLLPIHNIVFKICYCIFSILNVIYSCRERISIRSGLPFARFFNLRASGIPR